MALQNLLILHAPCSACAEQYVKKLLGLVIYIFVLTFSLKSFHCRQSFSLFCILDLSLVQLFLRCWDFSIFGRNLSFIFSNSNDQLHMLHELCELQSVELGRGQPICIAKSVCQLLFVQVGFQAWLSILPNTWVLQLVGEATADSRLKKWRLPSWCCSVVWGKLEESEDNVVYF